MKTLDTIALTLLIIGGINWLLVGLFQYDLVASIFGGQDSAGARIIYTIVGICALYCIKFFGGTAVDNNRAAR
ncbi:DUF378 domain-containing protein [Paenibacillus ihumii]|uniref:DUF378 domain-containing protein n=1 Tax=Paenibacillus ihumii TaxID=687436 RepID=UPI0006D84A7C|nr:DUF378 domain-containing protein [Paenibacillus ihumii]